MPAALRRARARGGRGAPPPSPALGVLVALVAVLMLVPLGYVVTVVLQVGVGTVAESVLRPRVGGLLVNTVLLVVLGVPASVVLGVGGAWLVERTDLPARRFFTVALAAPLAVPAFVMSYGWASSAGWVQGLGGGLLVAVLAYYPMVYLPALATLRGLDPALEESGRSLGLGPWAVFARVVAPQLRLATVGGGLVVGLHLLAEYGAFAFIRFDTLTTAIVVAYQSSFAGPAAASLGVVLAALCLVLLASESALRGHGRLARTGSGAPAPAVRAELGRWRVPAVGALVLLAVAALAVPLLSVMRWLGATDASALERLPSTVGSTVVLSVGGAVLAVVVALPVAWLVTRHPGGTVRRLESAYYVASSLPTIIIALALVTVTLAVAPGLYQTAFTVMAAYALTFLPRALVPLRAGIAQAPESLEEAARSLGVPPLVARVRITLPRLLPSVAAGGALVALGAANELTATLLLAPTGTRTLATQFWAATSSVDYGAAAQYALALVLLSVPAVALMLAQATGRGLR